VGLGAAGARISHVADLDGLTHAEYLILAPLDGEAATPLWEIAESFAAGVVGDPPTTEHLASLLAPALASTAVHGLVEVRRFVSWPAPWDRGVPVPAHRVAGESGAARLWSPDASSLEVLAVILTESGYRWL
jgi:hypothetical protein